MSRDCVISRMLSVELFWFPWQTSLDAAHSLTAFASNQTSLYADRVHLDLQTKPDSVLSFRTAPDPCTTTWVHQHQHQPMGSLSSVFSSRLFHSAGQGFIIFTPITLSPLNKSYPACELGTKYSVTERLLLLLITSVSLRRVSDIKQRPKKH